MQLGRCESTRAATKRVFWLRKRDSTIYSLPTGRRQRNIHSANGLRERTKAFRDGLRVLGHDEGRDIVIEARWADGHYERLPGLLAELIASKVDVIVTHGTPGALAAKQATTTIPIVVAVVGDALNSGVVSNLAKPETNLTGSTFFGPELAAKRLEILKEAMPNLLAVGVLTNLSNPMNEPIMPQMREVGSSRKLTLRQYDARSPADLDGVISAMKADVGAFVLLDDLNAHRQRRRDRQACFES